ncbi:MAG TPA: biopolymer transporter ExbD [Blastocatellia bacterium]|nr:biopolymer transporter ExbD [Blastocatellia bacterium]
MSVYVPLTPISGPTGEPGPPQQSVPPPPPKKSMALVWVLVTLVVMTVIAMSVGRYIFRKQMVDFGIDPDLMQKNPALAVAKAMVARNPDVYELVSVDDEKRLITIRNKQTGTTNTINMDDDPVVMSWIEANPNDGEFYIGRDKIAQADIPTRFKNLLKNNPDPDKVVYIKSGKLVKYGTVVSVADAIRDAGFDRVGVVAEKGASPRLLDWFPSYPNATVGVTQSSAGKDGESGIFDFSTNDSIETVVKFYEDKLKKEGLKVSTNTVQQSGVIRMGSLACEDAGNKRAAFLSAILEQGHTKIIVVIASKK